MMKSVSLSVFFVYLISTLISVSIASRFAPGFRIKRILPIIVVGLGLFAFEIANLIWISNRLIGIFMPGFVASSVVFLGVSSLLAVIGDTILLEVFGRRINGVEIDSWFGSLCGATLIHILTKLLYVLNLVWQLNHVFR